MGKLLKIGSKHALFHFFPSRKITIFVGKWETFFPIIKTEIRASFKHLWLEIALEIYQKVASSGLRTALILPAELGKFSSLTSIEFTNITKKSSSVNCSEEKKKKKRKEN